VDGVVAQHVGSSIPVPPAEVNAVEIVRFRRSIHRP
jgi:hypothetical protein